LLWLWLWLRLRLGDDLGLWLEHQRRLRLGDDLGLRLRLGQHRLGLDHRFRLDPFRVDGLDRGNLVGGRWAQFAPSSLARPTRRLPRDRAGGRHAELRRDRRLRDVRDVRDVDLGVHRALLVHRDRLVDGIVGRSVPRAPRVGRRLTLTIRLGQLGGTGGALAAALGRRLGPLAEHEEGGERGDRDQGQQHDEDA
jgi:hypothetical protein